MRRTVRKTDGFTDVSEPVGNYRDIVVILLTMPSCRVDCAALMHPNSYTTHQAARNPGLWPCSIGYRVRRDASLCALESCEFMSGRKVLD